MPTTKDIVWAMNVRTHHNEVHDVEMGKCTVTCVFADRIIQEDEEAKRRGV